VAIHDKDGWLGSFEVFERLLEADELLVRVWQSFPWDRLEELRTLGLRSGFGHDLLRFGYLKGFMDGTLGSATARLLDGSGVEISSREVLEDVVRRGAEVGWPVAVHAIGDGANRAALDAFEATREAWEPAGLRPRIEHAQLLDDADMRRFAEIGVTASVQFSHAPSDRDLAERLWEARDGAYAYRSLLDAGTVLVNGSDAPVEELDPLAGLRAAAEQEVPAGAALESFTVAPAWLSFDEDRRGRLRAGFDADLVVLDRDPLTGPASEVLGTMVAGNWVGTPEW
jgi:predicted amidohydrolase YtcJ